LPKEGQARGVQIDLDPAILSLRFPMEAPLADAAALTLRALLPRLRSRSRDKWRDKIEEAPRDWWTDEDKRAHLPADPINPELFFWELSDRLPDDSLIGIDTGMSTTFFARAIRVRRRMQVAISGTLAIIGPAVSYGLAGKLAFPQRPAFVLVGDGAMHAGPERPHHSLEVLATMGRSPLRGGGAEQLRSQHGDLGAARAGRLAQSA